ncbi:MAG: hypothetical protein V7707_20400 [Motiliproteus sp.]
MNKLVTAALLTSALLLPVSQSSYAESTTPPGNDPSTSIEAQQIIAELLNNMDWELLMRMQKNLLDNMDLLVPYTQEYIGCLEHEGYIDPNQPMDLQLLLDRASNASNSCNGIIRTLISELNFDITQEEFEQGLSPEYQEMLRKSL